MKLNLKNITYDVIPGLEDLGNNENMKKLKGKEISNLLRTIKIIEEESKQIEKIQNKIVESYGERDEEGNLVSLSNGVYKMKESHSAEARQKIEEAVDKEIEVPFEPITMVEYEEREFSMSNVKLMKALYDIFIIEEA